jgi:hypothetical protein
MALLARSSLTALQQQIMMSTLELCFCQTGATQPQLRLGRPVQYTAVLLLYQMVLLMEQTRSIAPAHLMLLVLERENDSS